MNEKILVVDDERELADLLELYLKNDGYTVYKFYNGRDALEVVARVKTQLRRCQRYNPSAGQAAEKNEYDIRGLLFNKDSHKCFLFGKELALTPIEFSILWYLCEQQGRVVTSEELFEAVWKEKYLNNSNEEQINRTPVFDTMKVRKSRRFYFCRQKSEGQYGTETNSSSLWRVFHRI